MNRFDQLPLFDDRAPVAVGDLAVGDRFSHSGWDVSVVTERTDDTVTWETTDTGTHRRVGVSTTSALSRMVERR